MSVKHRAHYGVLLAFGLVIFGLPPEFRAQIRLVARVEPNKNKVNNTGEIYDSGLPAVFAPTGIMIEARRAHTATTLPKGQVLVAGGHDGGHYLQTAEIFDPATAAFSQTNTVDSSTSEVVPSFLNVPRAAHTATLLTNGMVLIVGGYNGSYLDSAEIYNPSTGKFTATAGAMSSARAYHTAALLPGGKVLIVGGYDGSNYLKTAELYDPSSRTFTLLSAGLSEARSYHTMTLMSSGEVLVAGGYNDSYLATAEIYNSTNNVFRNAAKVMASARGNHAAALLSDGTILIAGGTNDNPLGTAEIFDPAAATFTATAGAMTAAREGLTATTLANGQVLIAGGSNGKELSTAEIYNPSSRTFAALPRAMAAARQNHTATLLGDGTVLLAGGQNSKMLIFDVNADSSDNVAPNILFSPDSQRGFVACTGSGAVIVFSPVTGEVLKIIETGGKPTYMTPLADGRTVAVVSAWDNRIFLIDINSAALVSTLAFSGADFGFGSTVTIAHDGSKGFISSTGTGEVIKFSLPSGQELGRLSGLQTPGPITLTPEDSTLMVVDSSTAQLVFVNPATMTQKAVLKASDTDSYAAFSVFNNAVLSADGSTGIIASRGQSLDEESIYTYTVFIFNPATGEVLNTIASTWAPGRTALTPDGQNWVILNEGSLLVIPTANPDSYREFTAESDPLLSANLIFSADSRYAYYTSATSDYFLQQELATTAIVGKLLVGDNPNTIADQPSSVAMTPDGKIFAVLDFASNNLELITASAALQGTKFISNANQTTGVTLINLSDREISVRATAYTDYGSAIEGTNIVNPVDFWVAPNGQMSLTVDQLFHFDWETEQTGWLDFQCDQAGIVGYLAIMMTRPMWLGAYVDRMDGVPLVTKTQHDWIIPQLSRDTGDTVELNFLNPNYSQANYSLSRLTKDGSVIEERTGSTGTGQQRISQVFNTVYTQSLPDQVLIVGGQDASSTLTSAETSDASGGAFTATAGSLNRAFKGHTATALSSGKVLIVGGKDSGDLIMNTAEIYDPVSGTFAVTTGAMMEYRYRCAATLLPNGRVLVSGGQTRLATSNTAEIYNPTSDTFQATTGFMLSPRDAHTATLLPDGRVLITGGASGDRIVDTAEIYDPGTGTFASTGNMMVPRAFHTATLLANGKVLIAGGYNGSYLNSAEVYDPATGRFTPTANSMTRARSYHTATLLSDGRTLIAGGSDGGTSASNTAEMYDSALNAFTPTIGTMTAARDHHTATKLINNQVLLLGGTDGSTTLNSAEIYDPEVDSFAASPSSMTTVRTLHTATLLPGGTDGYIRVTSTEGFAFSEFFGNADQQAALNGIDVTQFASVPALFSPHFAMVFGFHTILNVINANANPAEITIKLHGADGALLCGPVTRYLTPGAQLKDDLAAIFGHDVLLQKSSGWLEINTTSDFVVGTISFTNPDGEFLTSFQLQGTPMTDFLFPLAPQDGTFQTAIALLNAGDENAAVDIELWGPNGTLDRIATLNLPPGNRTAQYLSQYFPGLGDRLVSNVRIHAKTPIFGFGLVHDKDLHFMTALPPMPYPEIR